jgi:hypothetical protein
LIWQKTEERRQLTLTHTVLVSPRPPHRLLKCRNIPDQQRPPKVVATQLKTKLYPEGHRRRHRQHLALLAVVQATVLPLRRCLPFRLERLQAQVLVRAWQREQVRES